MLTPLKLSYAFKKFCAKGSCNECRIFDPFKECSRKHPFASVGCDIIWFVYDFLVDRGLLHKNPNDLNELLVEDDLQKLAASIINMWDIDAIFNNPTNTSGSTRPRQCKFCPQRSECDNHRTSCRLYFALTNYRHLLDVIQHATTLRETS